MLRAFHRLIWRLDLFTVLVFRKKNWFLVSILLLGAQFKSISSESISRLRALHLSKVDLFSTFIQQILQKELSLLVGGLGHTMFIRHLFFFSRTCIQKLDASLRLIWWARFCRQTRRGRRLSTRKMGSIFHSYSLVSMFCLSFDSVCPMSH